MNIKNIGFTLIELLVVIVIVGILSGIGVSQFKQYQGKTHDAKRLSEVLSIKKALNLYYVQNNEYPNPGGTASNCSNSTPGYYPRWQILIQALGDSIQNISEDAVWPYCIFYRYGGFHSQCDEVSNPGYALIFATEATVYPNLDIYASGTSENGSMARYCVYP